ncbi:MAG: hypothetical protein P8H31_00975 [Porticoccaceae bacterium]|nr:hypothetical protein [Porticoccaceae bacterium]
MKGLLEKTWFVSLVIGFSFVLGLLFLALSKLYFDDEILITITGLLGAYLTISVVVNILHKWILQPYVDLTQKKEIEGLISDKIDNLIENSRKYGFDGLVDQIDFQAIFDDLNENDTLWWLDTFSPGHTAWEDNIKQALKRGANINMLVLSPNADHLIKCRADEIGGQYTPERFKSEIERFIEYMEHIVFESSGEKGNLEIRLYDDLLAVPMYIVSTGNKARFAYSSFYLNSATAINFPHLKWKESGEAVIEMLFEYIQFKWNKKVSVHK